MSVLASIVRNPLRTTSWSSATSNLILLVVTCVSPEDNPITENANDILRAGRNAPFSVEKHIISPRANDNAG
jgi:hypothetical protein